MFLTRIFIYFSNKNTYLTIPTRRIAKSIEAGGKNKKKTFFNNKFD